MIYVDEDLCTGCGMCLDVCPQRAVSLVERRVVIDATRCTSCGRCADACVSEAIVEAEIMERQPSRPTITSAAFEPIAPSRTTAPSLRPSSPSPEAGVPTQPSSLAPSERPSKLQVADKVLSGLLNVLAFALDRGQGRQGSSVSKGSSADRLGRATDGVDVRKPRRESARRGGREQKRGKGLGGGRGRERRRCSR
jgi:NAD-dependent dihydropyrimidine dehydrogenase PreA subunit